MLIDSFGNKISRGYIALSLIGYSGSGCTQHLRKAKVCFNGAVFTLGHKVACPGHTYKRGTPIHELLCGGMSHGSCFSSMITKKQFDSISNNRTIIIFNKDDFMSTLKG